MSLAELLSDSKGLSNFSGNASTCIRNYSIKESAAAVDTVSGGLLPAASRGFANKNLQVTSGDHLNLLNASATGSVMGAEIVSKVSFLVNDNRSTVGFAVPPRDDLNIKLYEGSVKASGSLGAVEWGKSLSLFGSSAKACDVTPGAGFTASEPAMQFKFTLPELTPGLKVDLALANLARDNVSSIVSSRIDVDADVHAVTSTRNLGLEGKVSYDTGYGAVLNLEFLNNKTNGISVPVQEGTNIATQEAVALAAGLSDKIKGLAGSIDVDMSGFTGCLGTAKTEGLGHLHPAVGGFEATAGARKYKHTFGKAGYTMDASVASVPLKIEAIYGKTEQDGSKGTHTATNLFKENKRTGICIGTPLSEDLTFDLCYDRYETKNSVGLTNKMNVTSVCGLYKF